MGKINLENIRASLNKARDAAAPLQNQGYLSNIPVEYIRPAKRNVFNENDTDEAIKELADDIAACGLQHPIAVNKINSENYRIISGERRFKAMTEYLHKKTIPCMIFENLSEEQEQLRLFMANLSVREYTASQKYKFYLEVKELLERMKESGQYRGGMQKGIADILNVTKRQVAKYSAIEKLPFNIQQEVLEGKISINKAVEMAAPKKQESDNAALLSDILSKLSDENRDKLLSGDIDLNNLIAHSKKDEPVHLFNNETFTDNEQKKDEPVHLFDNETFTDNEQKKDEPVHLFNNETFTSNEQKKDEPVHHFDNETFTDNKQKKDEPVHHFEDVLLYGGKQYILNDVQVLEENNGYTVFKIMAVQK